ncbi:hypothetical protein BB561_006926, partial [Smittium simulii]
MQSITRYAHSLSGLISCPKDTLISKARAIVSAAHIIGAEESYDKIITSNKEYKTQLTAAESQYNQLAAKLDAIKKHNKDLRDQNFDLKTQLDNKTRDKTEMYMQYQQEKIDILTREKNLAEKEADLYRRQSELATCPISTSSILPVSTSTIPKVPEFHGSIVGFSRWISWVSDLFDNYPQLTDFNKRLMVTDSLKGDARSWYDAEPDSSTLSWDTMKDALLRQYGGTNSISNALKTISALKLTARADFNSFIQQIRPAIQLVTKKDDTLAVA